MNVTKATRGINRPTHGGHDGHRSVAPQTDDTGPTEPLQDETQSTVGSQSDSATHWLKKTLTGSHEDRHEA